MSKTFLIALAGGSGSGKTTLASSLHDYSSDINMLSMDHYYNDLSHWTAEQKENHNFDHPASIDFPLFISDLNNLKNNKTIQRPSYNFTNHHREQSVEMRPSKVLIVDGLFSLYHPETLGLYDLKIYIDTDDDLRLNRRIRRDIKERSRSLESILDQYEKSVHPMYHSYVKPTRIHADFQMSLNTRNEKAFQSLTSMIQSHLQKENLK
ncbi:MAG: uridine kinase [Oligoflexales bacterium]